MAAIMSKPNAMKQFAAAAALAQMASRFGVVPTSYTGGVLTGLVIGNFAFAHGIDIQEGVEEAQKSAAALEKATPVIPTSIPGM
jgi:hypothetical protein